MRGQGPNVKDVGSSHVPACTLKSSISAATRNRVFAHTVQLSDGPIMVTLVNSVGLDVGSQNAGH